MRTIFAALAALSFAASAQVVNNPQTDASQLTTGVLAVARGGTATGTQFTSGSVVFSGASGVYTQDNAKLFWDDTNFLFGIGSASPVAVLTVAGSRTATPSLPSGSQFSQNTSTFTDNNTAGSGTVTGMSFNSFNTNNLAATNSSVTTTTAANVYIRNAVRAGSNETITSSYGLLIDAISTLANGGAATTGWGLYAKAPSGATTNNAAGFKGTVTFDGTTSGSISAKGQAAAGTWEWDWPTTAGTAGQVLTSQAGGGTAMTWTDKGTIAAPLIISGSSATVSGTGCAAGTPTPNNVRGTVTTSASTSCTVTFSATLSSTPVCTGTSSSNATPVGVTSVSTSAVTFASAALTGSIYYNCIQ